MKTKVMKCGCAPQGSLKRGNETEYKIGCLIHSETEFMDPQPDLAKRQAKCGLCGRQKPSDPRKLAFFESLPEHKFDHFYCGCHGWD